MRISIKHLENKTKPENVNKPWEPWKSQSKYNTRFRHKILMGHLFLIIL